MKKSIIIVLLVFVAIVANAIPAKPGKVVLTAKDGSAIEATLVGDEFHHTFVSNEGFIVNQLEGTDFYEISEQRFDAAQVEAKRMAAKAQRGERMMSPKSIEGSQTFSKGLVILVSFSDKAFTETAANFSNLLNQQGYNYNGATGSAKDYFNSVSYGQYNPVFDVYGPYTLPRTMSYYGSNGYGGSDQHPDQMVVDAVELLTDQCGDTILRRYDCDNDGYVDNVFIYYAGYAESSGASANTIWPHRWWVMEDYVTGTITYAGKTIYDYACSSEYDGTSGSKRTGIGAFTHEFSHVLGLPDLYVTSASYSNTPATPEEWDIMDAGCYNNDENTPPAYSSEERFYVGWLTPTVINSTGTFTLNNINDGNGQAYLISSSGAHNLNGTNPNPTTYYLLENRQKTGWDKYIPGHGMLIWKIQYSSSKWYNNTVNNNANSMGCTIVSAKDPNNFVNRSCSPGDSYPGTKNVTSYAPYNKYSITGITERNSVITFTIADASGVEETEMANGIVMFSADGEFYTVDNIPDGAMLRCFDAMGRELWNAENVGTTYTFSNGGGMFFLQVESNGKVCTLRGI